MIEGYIGIWLHLLFRDQPMTTSGSQVVISLVLCPSWYK